MNLATEAADYIGLPSRRSRGDRPVSVCRPRGHRALAAVRHSPVIVRVGLIGSAATEVASASIAAGTMGANLGDETFTRGVFIVALMAMSLSGAGWMISTLILTPVFRRSSHRLEKVNPALMSIVPGAALLAAFAALTFRELPKSPTHVIAVVVSAVVMGICLFPANRLKLSWLKEWGLGISLLVGLVAAYFAHYAGLGLPEA